MGCCTLASQCHLLLIHRCCLAGLAYPHGMIPADQVMKAKTLVSKFFCNSLSSEI